MGGSHGATRAPAVGVYVAAGGLGVTCYSAARALAPERVGGAACLTGVVVEVRSHHGGVSNDAHRDPELVLDRPVAGRELGLPFMTTLVLGGRRHVLTGNG